MRHENWSPPELQCFSPYFVNQLRENYEEKRLISRFAVQELISGDNPFPLIIDIGATTTVFARVLAEARLNGIQVATHSLSAALQFSENVAANVIGYHGAFMPSEAAFIPDGLSTSLPRRFDPFGGLPYTAVISAEAFSVDRGASSSKTANRRLTRFYIRNATSVILLMENSRFAKNRRPTITMCGLKEDRWLREEKPFILVTSSEPGDEPEEMKKILHNENLKNVIRGNNEFSSVIGFVLNLMPSKD